MIKYILNQIIKKACCDVSLYCINLIIINKIVFLLFTIHVAVFNYTGAGHIIRISSKVYLFHKFHSKVNLV